MKIVSHELTLSSQASQEEVMVNESLEVVVSSAPDMAVAVASQERLTSEVMTFHKAVISEVLGRLAERTEEGEVNLYSSDALHLDFTEIDQNFVAKGQVLDSFDSVLQAPGFGRVVQERMTSISRQRVDFSAQGVIRTDSSEVRVDLSFSMSRNLLSDTAITALLKDPLVINYGTDLAGLSDKKFMFDIDNDGLSDQISMLKKGSGFLALDRNNDGKINNGNELFGTKSGDGFSELAVYDKDKNGWIDANDAIFDKLRVWIKDDSGADRLVALGEVGIGAIYLGNAETLFAMNDETNSETYGQLKQTGIFLKTNGDVGTVQNVDFAVRSGAQMLADTEEELAAYAAMSDYSEFAVTSTERPKLTMDDAGKKQGDIINAHNEKRSALQQKLSQLESRLSYTTSSQDTVRLNSLIAQTKSELSAVETESLLQLFNTVA